MGILPIGLITNSEVVSVEVLVQKLLPEPLSQSDRLEIEREAYRIFEERQARGLPGNAAGDWERAKRLIAIRRFYLIKTMNSKNLER